jgi:epoxyqueuosine reductase
MPQSGICPPNAVYIAPFARRNYYREAVTRLQNLARVFRARYGGVKADYRIFCNSPVPEKPLAAACGLGSLGRNSLVITPEAGSRVIIAALTLPFPLEGDHPEPNLPACGSCEACVAACPTGAVMRSGGIDRLKCIQWYASGNAALHTPNGDIPPFVAAQWGRRLYGCTPCQDACPYNAAARIPPRADKTDALPGDLPSSLDAKKLLAMTDEEIKAFFKGSAMGLAWLKPAYIRRNAERALRAITA